MSNSSAELASETVVVNKHNTIIPAEKHFDIEEDEKGTPWSLDCPKCYMGHQVKLGSKTSKYSKTSLGW